jgi:hypothetical protein
MELASLDLDRHFQALDRVLTAYHTLDMDAIKKFAKVL